MNEGDRLIFAWFKSSLISLGRLSDSLTICSLDEAETASGKAQHYG